MRGQARGAKAEHHAGLLRQHELTAQAFDADGFYKLGDAVKFQDPADPGEGLFDGRIAEDFKLATGTWVNVGPLRARLLARLEPYARDVVIAGADRNEIGALIFPNLDACRTLAAGAADVADARVLAEFRARLAASRARARGARTASAAPSSWASRPRSTPAK